VSTSAGTAVVFAPLAGAALDRIVRAAWDAGEAVVPVNPALTAHEHRELLEQVRPTHLCDADGRRRVEGGVPALAGTAAIVVTSGTTAAPKCVELTAAGRDTMGRGYSAALGVGPGDRWLACLPLHHVASLGVVARSYVTDVPCVVHDSFDIDRVARSPRDEGTTIVALVPTTLRRLLDAGAPLHDYRVVISGGAPCPPDLWERAVALGVPIVDVYGLSETWSGCLIDGAPIAGMEVMAHAGNSELLVRGAPVMRGYRRDPERTAEAFTPDGWFRTGDVGVETDGGRFRVVDRLKDVVISGGVNVSPTEVEAVLAGHPDLADVCVVGVPDDEWGERVVAFVVPRAGRAAPSVADLRAFARDRLTAAKLPREARVVDAIPRSHSGKALRRALRRTS
jgi:O-succinylbenzoic acid--CoA ligase